MRAAQSIKCNADHNKLFNVSLYQVFQPNFEIKISFWRRSDEDEDEDEDEEAVFTGESIKMRRRRRKRPSLLVNQSQGRIRPTCKKLNTDPHHGSMSA